MFYQGTGKIEVIIKKDGGGGATETAAKEKAIDEIGGGAEEEQFSFWLGTSNKNRKKRVIKTNLTHSLAVSKQVFDLGFEYWVGGLGYKNGDQAYQDNVSRRFEIIKDGSNLASSISMGALYGSWGGPIGAVLGMSFAAVSTGVSLASKYANRQRDYNYKIFKEQNAVQYNRARAGINLTNGRLR